MKLVLVIILIGFLWTQNLLADPLPTQIDQCSFTLIDFIGYRLGDDDPQSGSYVHFANGGVQISLDVIPAIHNSLVGDPVSMCLLFIPTVCPPGDVRGRIYHTTNLRTGEFWVQPDAAYSCGGA